MLIIHLTVYLTVKEDIEMYQGKSNYYKKLFETGVRIPIAVIQISHGGINVISAKA